MSHFEKSSKRSLRRLVRRLAAACEGMAATEFALIAPVMITLFFGVTELSDGFEASTKVTSVASTAADLVAQEKIVCNAEMADVFATVNAIMFPYPVNAMQVRISSLIDGGSGTVRVAWSDGQNIAPLPVNSTVSVPAGLVDTGGSVIMAEVGYNYSSTTGKYVYGVVPMSDRFYLHPRRVAQISRTASSC